jgi:hypothetical protein
MNMHPMGDPAPRPNWPAPRGLLYTQRLTKKINLSRTSFCRLPREFTHAQALAS